MSSCIMGLIQMAPGAERPESQAMTIDPLHGKRFHWNDAWNEEKQEYVFPWGGGNNLNLAGLPHHHPQHPEDWEPGDPVD